MLKGCSVDFVSEKIAIEGILRKCNDFQERLESGRSGGTVISENEYSDFMIDTNTILSGIGVDGKWFFDEVKSGVYGVDVKTFEEEGAYSDCIAKIVRMLRRGFVTCKHDVEGIGADASGMISGCLFRTVSVEQFEAFRQKVHGCDKLHRTVLSSYLEGVQENGIFEALYHFLNATKACLDDMDKVFDLAIRKLFVAGGMDIVIPLLQGVDMWFDGVYEDGGREIANSYEYSNRSLSYYMAVVRGIKNYLISRFYPLNLMDLFLYRDFPRFGYDVRGDLDFEYRFQAIEDSAEDIKSGLRESILGGN